MKLISFVLPHEMCVASRYSRVVKHENCFLRNFDLLFMVKLTPQIYYSWIIKNASKFREIV